MRVVLDASPVIFLAKLRRLELVRKLFGNDMRLSSSVREETLAPGVDSGEKTLLEAFFARCSVEAVRGPQRFALAMSRPDNDTLSLAVQRRAELLLCDDRIMRLMAEAEGIRPLGTIGILLRAMREGLLSNAETRQLLDDLVRLHGFRIGIEVYQSVLAQIELHGARRRR